MVVTMVHFFLLQLETFSAARMKLNFRYIGSAPHDSDWIILSVKRHLHSRSVQLNSCRTESILKSIFLLFLLLSSQGSGPTGYYNLLHNCPQTDGAGAGVREAPYHERWSGPDTRTQSCDGWQNMRRAIRDIIINKILLYNIYLCSVVFIVSDFQRQ